MSRNVEIKCCYECPHYQGVQEMEPVTYCKLLGGSYKDCFPNSFDEKTGIWDKCPLPEIKK